MKKIIAFLLIISIKLNAQPPKTFYTRLGGSGYDIGYDIQQTLDKGYIITGSTSSFGFGNTDAYLIKTDSMGQKKWQTSFGDSNNDVGKSVIQLADSSFVVLGYTNSNGFGGYDIYLIKADKVGNKIWEKTIGGSDWDFGYSIQTTTDGGFIIAGSTYSKGYGSADGYVIKTNSTGDVVWDKTFGGVYNDEFKSVIQTTDGGYALCGYTKSYNDLAFGDAWAFKLNSVGDSVWSNYYGGNKQDLANQIIESGTGEYFLAGATESYGLGKLDAFGLKINASGALIWHFEEGFASSDESFNSVTLSTINSGNSVYCDTQTFPGFGIQVKLFEVNSGGYYVGATDYGSTLSDEVFKIIPTKDHGYACVGYTYGFGATLSDVYLLKVDSSFLNSNLVISVNEPFIKAHTIECYPNPVKDKLTVSINEAINTSALYVFDITGNAISMDYTVINNKLTVDFSVLANGIYVLKYKTATKKIIVAR